MAIVATRQNVTIENIDNTQNNLTKFRGWDKEK